MKGKSEMKNLLKITCVVAVAIFAVAQAKAALITNETFSYADGDLATVSGGIWAPYSGTTALNVSGGHAVVTDASSQDDALNFGAGHSNDVLFASFDVTVTSLPRAVPGYFAFFKDSTSFNFAARVYGSNDAGSVRFGIANVGGAATNVGVAFWGSSVALGSTNKIVIRLDQTGASFVSTLWLNPTQITDPSVTASDVGAISLINVQAFALRQASTSTGAGTENVDNLLIGTTFGDVVAAIPEPSTVALVGLGILGSLAFRRRRSVRG